jgi:protein TonB
MIVLAASLSVALHAGLILGVGRAPKTIASATPAEIPTIRLTIPELKDLEEPEPASVEDAPPPAEMPTLVPMQADLPQIPSPSDFVQPLDFSSLIERPDFSQLTVMSVPERFHGGTGRIAQSIGAIFNLADLDRIPEPIFQPAPMFPHLMRRENLEGIVVVEFIVDTEGRAINATVCESLYPGFNDAAIKGVAKWKFRPGVRGGRKVNTRMRVPISFKLADEIN